MTTRSEKQDANTPWTSLRARLPVFAITAFVALGIWWACLHLLPPLPHMSSADARLVLAAKLIAVASLFTLVAAIEAVAHERLVTPAFDPLAGKESRRLKINLRYLQNTLEQFIVFAAGLLGLAAYADDGSGMRAAIAATIVFVAARYVFWIGYHSGSANRVPGLVGAAQGMLILLYVTYKAGCEVAGLAGGAGAIGLYLLVEAAILFALRSARRDNG